jgi:hypothetical protein
MAENETVLALAARLEAAAKNTDAVWQGAATRPAVLRLAAALREAAALLRQAGSPVHDFYCLPGERVPDCIGCDWLARRKALLGEVTHG